MVDTKLPSFIVIGAMKAGTSSLHTYLALHPKISMPVTRKELDFFNNRTNWEKGVNWYKSNFPENDLLKGEASPNYAMYPAYGTDKIPERMFSILPDARLIYILRDPIERILSQVHHQWVDGTETRTIDQIVKDTSDKGHYRDFSRYCLQVERFLKYYPKERIMITTLETLSSNPQEIMSEVFQFLQVDSDFYHKSFSQVFHASSDKKVAGKFQKNLESMCFLLPQKVALYLQRIFSVSIPKPTLTELQEKILENDLREDVKKLREFTGKDFGEWKYQY